MSTVAVRPRVAMVGDGQLAQMTQQAAVSLGVELRVLGEDPDAPAVRAGAEHVLGRADDPAALRRLAEGCAVLSFDHEGAAPELLAELEADGIRLAPGAEAKALGQDKLRARRELGALGLPVPAWALVHSTEQATAFGAEHGWPVVAKAPRGGYDGRGVWELADAEAATAVIDAQPDGLLLEPLLAIDCELAVLVARSAAGELASYPVVETVQRDGMCRETRVPAAVSAAHAAEAEALARDLAERIGLVGIMAVELFLTPDGLLVNELALRPHNSGHWTIEGSETSQFEQHLRAVLGWPLGATGLRGPTVVCVNVVGPEDGSDPRDRLPAALSVAGAHVHLYGKAPRPGRKLGHVTVCGSDADTVRATALRAAALLHGEAQ